MSQEELIEKFFNAYQSDAISTTQEVCQKLGIDINDFFKLFTDPKYSEKINSFFEFQSAIRFHSLKENAIKMLFAKVNVRVEKKNVVKTVKAREEDPNQTSLFQEKIVSLIEEETLQEVYPSSADLKFVFEQANELSKLTKVAGGAIDLSKLSSEEQTEFLKLYLKTKV